MPGSTFSQSVIPSFVRNQLIDTCREARAEESEDDAAPEEGKEGEEPNPPGEDRGLHGLGIDGLHLGILAGQRELQVLRRGR